jgi:cysteine sulfinate desulfinase/cysteine desulfurase-like protein
LGNASTDYASTNGAANAIRNCSALIKKILNAPNHEICFNSGASEGNNYIFQTVADQSAMTSDTIPHVILSSIEHKSSLLAVEKLVKLGRIEATLVQPDLDGRIDPVRVAETIKPNTCLISIMHSNNETGTVNDLKEIGKVAKTYGVLFHSDIAQSFCKLPIDLTSMNIDIATMSMHKVYGPIGLGAIVMSPTVAAFKIAQISGTQYGGLRGGTENLSAIVAAQHAITETLKERSTKHLQLLKHKMHIIDSLNKVFMQQPFHEFYGHPDSAIPSQEYVNDNVRMCFTVLGGDPTQTLPGTLLMSFFKAGSYDLRNRFCNIKLKQALFKRRIIISIGSACNTKAAGPSHVLAAIQAPFVIRSGVIRISLLDSTEPHKVDYLIKNLIEAVKEQL